MSEGRLTLTPSTYSLQGGACPRTFHGASIKILSLLFDHDSNEVEYLFLVT